MPRIWIAPFFWTWTLSEASVCILVFSLMRQEGDWSAADRYWKAVWHNQCAGLICFSVIVCARRCCCYAYPRCSRNPGIHGLGDHRGVSGAVGLGSEPVELQHPRRKKLSKSSSSGNLLLLLKTQPPPESSLIQARYLLRVSSTNTNSLLFKGTRILYHGTVSYTGIVQVFYTTPRGKQASSYFRHPNWN